MNNERIEDMVIEALRRFDAGESLEAVVATAGERGPELARALATARSLKRLQSSAPAEAQARSRQTFLDEARRMARDQEALRPAGSRSWSRSAWLGLAAMILLWIGAFGAAGSSLPGDPFYPLLRTVERVGGLTKLGPDAGLLHRTRLERRRQQEVLRLQAAGRDAAVVFDAVVEAHADGPGQWRVSGIAMRVPEDAIIRGTAEVGERIRIIGRVSQGELVASEIIYENHDHGKMEEALP